MAHGPLVFTVSCELCDTCILSFRFRSEDKSNILPDYINDPKYSNRQVWANSVDPDHIAPVRVYTVCLIVCICWRHYSMVKPNCSNVWRITANVSDV